MQQIPWIGHTPRTGMPWPWTLLFDPQFASTQQASCPSALGLPHFLQVWVTARATLPGAGVGLVKKLTPGVGQEP